MRRGRADGGGCNRTDGSTPGSGFFGTRLAVGSDRVVARRELGLEAAITKLNKYQLLNRRVSAACWRCSPRVRPAPPMRCWWRMASHSI
jgi:hypothetical protein